MEQTIEERVKNIVAEQLGDKALNVQLGQGFVDDLGADSLDMVELAFALEDEFDLQIGDDDLERIKTVQQAVDYVTAHVAK